jgi:4-amino-4-deoxy-L-arabinose transferase-like glycosyltransferase
LAAFLLRPGVFAPLAAIFFLATSLAAIHANVHSEMGRKDLLEGDTGHYLAIARDFARGDFSMSYVEARPHRQPLYPLLLAPGFRWFGGDLQILASVNVLLLIGAFLLLYFGILRFFHSRFVAAAIGFLFLHNPFVHAHATRHLLTEPLHLLLAIGVVFATLDYLESRRRRSLLAFAALAGLDYLTRPNGLFIFASAIAVLLLNEAWRFYRPSSSPRPSLSHIAGCYVLALSIFALVAAPSWIPRYHYFGNPIHHGYLSNYLWTDTYKEGHVGQRFASYTAKDYFENHHLGDVVQRWVRGVGECGFAIPIRTEEKLPLLYFLALGGLVATVWSGSGSYRTLAAFGVLQMLPLIWTNLSNPTIRVPYAAELPFELVFAALFLSQLCRVIHRGFLRICHGQLDHKLIFRRQGSGSHHDTAPVCMHNFAAETKT